MNLAFLVGVIAFNIFLLKSRLLLEARTYKVMSVMLVLTAIFDQILTGLPIVTYEVAKVSGYKLFNAPIEDFFYTIVVVILVGSLTEYTSRKSKRS